MFMGLMLIYAAYDYVINPRFNGQFLRKTHIPAINSIASERLDGKLDLQLKNFTLFYTFFCCLLDTMTFFETFDLRVIFSLIDNVLIV